MTVPQTNLAWETLFDLSATRTGPLHQRLAEAIRTAIRDGRLPLGAALPPSRVLAADLRVSRWTVTEAYGRLGAEGFVSGRTGSATRVAWSPAPDERVARSDRALAHPHHLAPSRYDLSQCTPDYRGFPRRRWAEAIRVAAETVPFDRLGYAEPGGEPRLREVLSSQLERRRGTRVDPALMSVFTGARQSMAALCRALVEDGHRRIAVEDPGSPGLWEAAQTAGLELVGIPVDGGGAVVDALEQHPDVRLICVGPAHQVVTGAVLTPERRGRLIAWARRVDGLIIEDDYDSEFSYDGPAPPAIHGADPHRVALIGSMSRTMTPTVNVGWIVVPRHLVDAVRAEPRLAATAPALSQLALAHFLETGDFDRHLRASRKRLRARRDILLAELARQLPEARLSGHQSGLHFPMDLPEGASATHVLAGAPQRSLALCDVHQMRLHGTLEEGRIQVGYGNLADSVAAEAAGVLAELVRASVV